MKEEDGDSPRIISRGREKFGMPVAAASALITALIVLS